MGLGDLVQSFGNALIPIKRMDGQSLMRALKNPIRYKKLVLDEKQSIIIYLDPNEIKIIGGIEIANTVINPEIGKGWGTNYNKPGQYRMEGKKAYLCHPKIPFALEVDEAAFHKQATITDKMREILRLPADWLQLQPEMIAMMGMTKWNQGFDERPGSTMIFIFGFSVGAVVIMLLIFLLFLLMTIFAKK